MKIIVGLGNIGKEYQNTRHNCGFMVIDEFAKELECEFKEENKFKAFTSKTSYKNKPIFLVKPTTYMNLSGQAVSTILNFYKESPENLVVIYDDIDLPLGKIRVRSEGSAGTHNGMKSIIQELGTQNFTRIRIGTESRGELAPKEQDLTSFVLSPFSVEESPIIKKSIKEAIKQL
ncbi:MAG: aminoacyl-tRNA hydrolase, partial [Candidatus Gracilibacteria bacterium]